MKVLLINVFAAGALAVVASTSFAAEPVAQQPVLLSASQMDTIDGAGRRHRTHNSHTATATADAVARGRNTNTDGYAWTRTDKGRSASYAAASSSSN